MKTETRKLFQTILSSLLILLPNDIKINLYDIELSKLVHFLRHSVENDWFVWCTDVVKPMSGCQAV